MKKILWHYIIVVCVVLFFSVVFVATAQEKNLSILSSSLQNNTYTEHTHPLIIDVMSKIAYQGSEIIIEEQLPKGLNHSRYRASYQSDNKKIFGLLAIPDQNIPIAGFPAVVVAHGYVPPNEYVTGGMYPELINTLSDSGYIVFMPDFRGHGESEGVAEGAYFSPGYTVDYLNAVSSLSRYKGVNPEKIGAWGHSMGGSVVLRSMVVNKRIQSASIWAGVVGTYPDLLFHWNNSTVWNSSQDQEVVRPDKLINQFGSINENLDFWHKISPMSYLDDVTIPVQIHHAIDDPIVPLEFSERLHEMLKMRNKDVRLYKYPGSDHELSSDTAAAAITHTVEFFNSTLR